MISNRKVIAVLEVWWMAQCAAKEWWIDWITKVAAASEQEMLVENLTCMNLLPYLVETNTIHGLYMLLLVVESLSTIAASIGTHIW